MASPGPAVGPGSYLAKDYASFRALLLDRLALTLPDWREQHAADLVVALLEVLAYAGDRLSYFQDAVATEAYLGTARQRISVRRHTRLVGYRMHSGCNARTWVALEVAEDLDLDLAEVCFTTTPQGAGDIGTVLLESALRGVPASRYAIYEPVADGVHRFAAADNRLSIDARGSGGVLPQGATAARLLAAPASQVAPGRVLVLEEHRDPVTGRLLPRPGLRHPVLVTGTERQGEHLSVTWDVADALPRPLLVSGRTVAGRADDLAVAYGNIVLADHGVSLSRLRRLQPGTGVPLLVTERSGAGPVVEVQVPMAHLTRRVPPDRSAPEAAGAAALLAQDPRRALADLGPVTVGHLGAVGQPDAEPEQLPRWEVREDLLHSGPDDRHVVVEFDDDDLGRLRFGDGELGASAPVAVPVDADLRIGNGSAGDVGADGIAHLVLPRSAPAVLRVHNPFPAAGVDPETSAAARIAAPAAIRRDQERAVTAEDYAAWAGRVTGVQKAAVRLTPSATGYRVDVFVDPLGRDELDDRLRARVAAALEELRTVGHRVVVQPARYLPLDVEIAYDVSRAVAPRSGVVAALWRALGSGRQADGIPGFFHPDRFTFGTPVASSQLVAAAMAVVGVSDARVRVLRLLDRSGPAVPDGGPLGVLPVGDHQIVRMGAGGAGGPGRLTLTPWGSAR